MPDGRRNSEFTSDGIVTLNVPSPFVETAEAVVRQTDGKLVLGGWGNVRLSDGRVRSRMIAARFTAAGALDTTFTSNGFSVDQLSGEGFYETHALFYDPQRGTILAGGFARPDSQVAVGDQLAFIRSSSCRRPARSGQPPSSLAATSSEVSMSRSARPGSGRSGWR